jgi:response regulator RpfG family c-di-GMP phosphodiesterase
MSAVGPAASPGRKPVNVLVVDDSADSLLALEALLGGLDRTILKASSGEQALKYLLQEDIGVILLDVKMAGLDGFETAAIIRENKRTRELPIIFMTAFSKDEADVARGYAVGAADYLFKPVVPEILRSKVNCFVELAKRTAALKEAYEELLQARQALAKSQADLEQRVQIRTAELAQANQLLQDKISELERFHDVVVGREMKLIELEEENRRLWARLKLSEAPH